MLSMGLGMIDPDNPLTALNNKLHQSDIYNGFQMGVSMLSSFSGAASQNMACFIAGTMVLTATGLVAIEKLSAGDVAGRNRLQDCRPKTAGSSRAARRGLHHKEAAHSGLALSGLRLGPCVSVSEFMRFAHLTREIVVRQQCGARTEINAKAKERADRDESAAHESHRRKAEMLRDEGSDKRSAANADIEDARIERCCDVRSIGGHHKHAGTERHADCRLSSAPEQKQRHEREPRRA